jgi:hypothetical protein
MTIFLTILFILILLNAALLFFSVSNAGQRVNKLKKSISEQSLSKIYPLDLNPTKYKKAI